MNLDDKTMTPMPAGEFPGLPSDTPPSKPSKRRKANGANGSGSRKKRKAVEEFDDDESGVDTATLTLSAAANEPRQRKKMLFEPSGSATVAAPVPAMESIQRTPAQEPVAPPAAVMAQPEIENVTPEQVEAPAQETAPSMPAAAPSVAETKGSVFQVATLVLHSSRQAPEEREAVAEVAPEFVPTAPILQAVPATSEVPESPAAAPAECPVQALESPIEEEAEQQDLVPAVSFNAAPVHVEEPPAAVAEAAPEAPQLPHVADKPAAVEAPSAVVPVAEPTPVPRAPAMSRFEAVAARAARISAQNGSRPVVQSPQPARPAAPVQEPAPPAELPVLAGDIYGYWSRMKNGRRFPSRADFNAEQVAEHWPNSMLLTCAKAPANSQAAFSSVLRLGATRRNRPEEDLNITSMITEWILATGGEAARAGKPVQDTEIFTSPEGSRAYKIVALPLSDQQTQVDHVLCHLSRS